MFKTPLLIGIFCLIIGSCKNRKEDSFVNATKASSSASAKNYPKYKVDFDYKNMSDDSFLLNFGRIIRLPSMLQMRDSLNIRIWIWGDTTNVINISLNNS